MNIRCVWWANKKSEWIFLQSKQINRWWELTTLSINAVINFRTSWNGIITIKSTDETLRKQISISEENTNFMSNVSLNLRVEDNNVCFQWSKLFINETRYLKETENLNRCSHSHKRKKMIDWTMTACYLSLTRISLKVLTNNLLLYCTPIIIIITKTANHHAFMLAFKTFIHFLEKTMVFSSFSHDLCD